MLKGELFSTDMVRALLDGRKKHTARPVKRKYDNTHFEYRTDKYGTEFVEMQNDVEGETFGKNSDGTTWRKLRGYIVPKPKFQPGDYMYVRETWAQIGEQYVYRADDETPEGWYLTAWHPSIHMPREASRLFYKVTKVEVMNLSDVDEQFAREDGFKDDDEYNVCIQDRVAGMRSAGIMVEVHYRTAKSAFKEFWENQYGPGTRWMWVCWMERCSKEEAWNG